MEPKNYPTPQELMAMANKKKRMYNYILIGLIAFIVIIIFSVGRVDSKKEKQTPISQRQELINEQFDPWNGSHINLTMAIQRSMHDPESFEHFETKYWESGDNLIIATTYRGKNAFGAKVLNTIQAEVSINGDIIKIYDAE